MSEFKMVAAAILNFEIQLRSRRISKYCGLIYVSAKNDDSITTYVHVRAKYNSHCKYYFSMYNMSFLFLMLEFSLFNSRNEFSGSIIVIFEVLHAYIFSIYSVSRFVNEYHKIYEYEWSPTFACNDKKR